MKAVASPGQIVHVRMSGRTLPAIVVLSNQHGFADLAILTGEEARPVMTAFSVGHDATGTTDGTWRWPPDSDPL